MVRASQRAWLAPALVMASGLLVLVATVYFGSLRPEYLHARNTISELGEFGSAMSPRVSYGVFLPAGALIWLALWLASAGAIHRGLSSCLWALSCFGLGYVVAAFFPCDPGSPASGSPRQLVHNAGGFIEYLGTAIGLGLAAKYFFKRDHPWRGAAFLAAALGVGAALVMLSMPNLFSVRGLVQRLAESLMFIAVFALLVPTQGNAAAARRTIAGPDA